MTLIKSVSGIRGTIGGKLGENLTPVDIVIFTSAFASWCKQHSEHDIIKVVVARDARISGNMIQSIVINTLIACGVDVINIGMATTPTTEIAVIAEHADGGIIITASHNPINWNALKMLNNKGEFLSQKEGQKILQIAQKADFDYATIDNLGTITSKNYLNYHIEQILKLPLVNTETIKNKNYRIVVDGINSIGSIAVPELLKKIGVTHIKVLNANTNGHFAHNPEPVDEHLSQIKQTVIDQKAHLGIVVDPDVDRLAFICEDGSMFGEEYTLVAIADYVLQNKKGNTVSNLSSSKALDDITAKYGGQCFHSAVGEVHVVQMMKDKQAVIGGEGNGGVIYPDLHYGRDALVGIALFLTYLSQKNITMSELKASLPQYFMVKHKININNQINFSQIKEKLKKSISYTSLSTIDGVRFDFKEGWVHIRTSNTEPIIRLYSEAPTQEKAWNLINYILKQINN